MSSNQVTAILGGDVYTPRRIIPAGVVLVEGERILAVGSAQQVPVPEGAVRVEARGDIIAPGLVDIHLHGGDGADFTDGSVEAVRTAARRHLRAGTTSIVPATSSAPLEDIWRAFDCIRAVMHAPAPDEAHVLGIHMEGPFFALAQRGAHPAELLRMPTPEERERLLSYGRELQRVSIAPEREGALELIRDLTARGILVSGAHSDALYEQVCLAMEAGMRHITHLWSGMSSVRRIGAKRYAGMLEAALVEDGLTGEIISDGYHLPTSLMKLAYRMKGAGSLCLVSDAMRASGLGPGVYDLSGKKAYVDPGSDVAFTEDRQAFAGSISTMAQCLQHAVLTGGLALPEALEMATLTPARIHGLDDRVGSLASGKLADVLILERATLRPRLVMCGGRVVVDKDEDR